jgi:hypothetical protein
MGSFGISYRISRLGFAAASTAPGLLVAAILSATNVALASQGPGGGQGTASSFTQSVMAVIVYGACALVAGAGLIGGVRRRLR